MPGRLSLPEVHKLLDLTPQPPVTFASGPGLSEVENDRAVHPLGGQSGCGKGRFLLLEDACGAFREEARLEIVRSHDRVEACCLRDPHGLEVLDRPEARETLGLQALPGELHNPLNSMSPDRWCLPFST